MKKIFTNGCFDVLHRGHLELLEYAKGLGTVFVGVDSDEKVRHDKGQDRPYNKLEDRIKMLESLRFVDEVRVFTSTKGLENLIKEIEPDLMVIGSDWEGKTVVGEQYAKELRFFKRVRGYSTTSILEYDYRKLQKSPKRSR
jgi:D-beta-D-heptose 7-phosphate kinase/D-beta-D-heptose 1-phosphate adenosyltransferase